MVMSYLINFREDFGLVGVLFRMLFALIICFRFSCCRKVKILCRVVSIFLRLLYWAGIRVSPLYLRLRHCRSSYLSKFCCCWYFRFLRKPFYLQEH
jgi:hypothetical protein